MAAFVRRFFTRRFAGQGSGGSAPVVDNALLLQDGTYFLLEDGTNLLIQL